MTAEKKEELATAILALLKKYDLDGDVNIFWGGKCLKGNGDIVNGELASERFKYATDDTVSMCFEGDLYDVLNYRYEALAEVFIPEFTRLLNLYGLFYEQGDEWNLGTYYHNAPVKKQEEEGVSPDKPTYITRTECPPLLKGARDEWERRQNEYGDVGSCVIGAGFTFKFQKEFFRMPPQGRWQGSISWEASADIIKQMLIGAGCEDVVFHCGVLD